MYLKLQSGDSIDLAVICSPKGVRKEITWWKDGKPVEETTPGAKSNVKYLIRVLDIEFNDELELQASSTLFRQIRQEAKRAHKQWEGFRFNLTREGEGLRTRYAVKALPGDNLDITTVLLSEDEPDEFGFNNDTASQPRMGFAALVTAPESVESVLGAITYGSYRNG
jgi:hypothetical protein